MGIRMSLVVSLAILLAGNAGVRAEGLRAGVARVKITPPAGIGMAGYYFERGAEGTNDELYAKTIVIQQGETRVALVGLDVISTTRGMVEGARRTIEKETGIPAGHVMISATHAHTGPVLVERGSREDAQGGEQEIAVAYSARLPALIAESVRLAAGNMRPVRISAGVGREEELSFNRRFFMTDGTVGWNPGKLNPKIVRPAGPIDPDVGVVLFEEVEERKPAKAMATYVNFAMHPDTVGGQLFSADYPGVLSRLLENYKGEEMVTLFANGACGNVNHVDVTWAGVQHGYYEAQRIGTVLAAEVMQTYKKVQPIKEGTLRVTSRVVKLPLPKVTAEEVEKARATVKRLGMKDNSGFMEKVAAYKVLDVAEREGRPQEVEVQVIMLGEELAWVSLPGEVFVELGLAIKKASPFRYTMIAELANGSIGYIPDHKAYAEGNYEPISARCAEGSGEVLVEAAVKMLGERRE